MNKFSSFKIAPPERRFAGQKIKIKRVFDKDITVLDFIIEDSKFTDKDFDKDSDNSPDEDSNKVPNKRLRLQFEMNGEKHILWTASAVLMEQIKQVDRRSLPFKTVIKEDEEAYKFT